MSRFAYPVVLGLAVVDAAGYSLIAPVLPQLAARTGSGAAAIGLLFSTFPAAMMLGFLLAGLALRQGLPRSGADEQLKHAHRGGGRGHELRHVLVGSILVSAVGAVGFVVGGGFALYVLARALMGLGSGGLWVALIMFTLARWPDDAYRRTSRVLAAYTAGGLVGPALGALGGIRLPFLGYLGLLLVAAVAALTLRAPPAAPVARGADRGGWQVHGFWLSAACITFAVVAGGLNEGVLPLHFATRLSQGGIAALFVGMAIVGSVASAAAGSFRPRLLLPFAIVLVVGGVGIAAGTSSVGLWVLALGLASVGGGIAGTAAMGFLIAALPVDRLVTGLVVWSQFSIVGYLVGPAVGGPVAEHLGYGALVLVPLLAAVPVLVLSLVRRTGSASRGSNDAVPPTRPRTRPPRAGASAPARGDR